VRGSVEGADGCGPKRANPAKWFRGAFRVGCRAAQTQTADGVLRPGPVIRTLHEREQDRLTHKTDERGGGRGRSYEPARGPVRTNWAGAKSKTPERGRVDTGGRANCKKATAPVGQTGERLARPVPIHPTGDEAPRKPNRRPTTTAPSGQSPQRSGQKDPTMRQARAKAMRSHGDHSDRPRHGAAVPLAGHGPIASAHARTRGDGGSGRAAAPSCAREARGKPGVMRHKRGAANRGPRAGGALRPGAGWARRD